MLLRTIGRIGTAIAAIAFTQAALVTPAAAQTTNECSAVATNYCTVWDTNYSSRQECWLQTYADCMNGIYPEFYVTHAAPPPTDPRRTRTLQA